MFVCFICLICSVETIYITFRTHISVYCFNINSGKAIDNFFKM